MSPAAFRRRVAARIQRARWRLGWTQADAAFRIGLTFRYFAEVERARRNPTLDVLYAIAHGLKVRVVEGPPGERQREIVPALVLAALDVEVETPSSSVFDGGPQPSLVHPELLPAFASRGVTVDHRVDRHPERLVVVHDGGVEHRQPLVVALGLGRGCIFGGGGHGALMIDRTIASDATSLRSRRASAA